MHQHTIIQYSIKKVIFWLIFLWWLWYSYTFAQKIVDIQTYVKEITTKDIDKTRDWISTQDKNVNYVFQTLCNKIINSWSIEISQNISYYPQESLFVTIVCNSILWDNKDNNSLPLSNILKDKRKNLKWIGVLCATQQLGNPITDTECENRSLDNTMDYPFLFHKVISKVQNDRVNLSLARIYGAVDTKYEKYTENDPVNNYISTHFQTIGFIPESKNYPQTYKKITEYIKNARTMQKEAYFIDYKTLTEDNLANFTGLVQKFFLKKDSWNTLNDDKRINIINTNILYNELFFYTLFASTYNEYLDRFWDKNEDTPQWFQNIKLKEKIFLQKARNKEFNTKIRYATRESIRQLINLESSYPIHIWYLMYQEDLLNIRDNLAKIYLPLHQLHYKLENVQSKN